MAWKETDRARACAVRRTYRCDDCAYQWRVVYPDGAPTGAPECPKCEAASQYVPPLPGVLTTKSQAIDYAHKMAEEDFGLTNMRDNQREGDVAVMGPPPAQTAEIERMTRELKELAEHTQASGEAIAPEVAAMTSGGFWQDGGLANSPSLSSQASAATAQQRAEGVDPVGMLEQGRQAGISTRMRYQVVGADAMPQA